MQKDVQEKNITRKQGEGNHVGNVGCGTGNSVGTVRQQLQDPPVV